MRRAPLTLLLIACAAAAGPAAAQTPPRAEANDQRTPAGRMADGELRIELEALEAAWYPRGPDGPRIVTPAFAEVGAPPRVPGPLIRASKGTPVHVTIRNTLERPIAVRGLLDRASMASESAAPGAGALPAFAFSEPVVIPPGEIGESRFTPTAEVSSFYYGQVLPAGAGPDAVRPFSRLEEGAFMGALVVDAALVRAGKPYDLMVFPEGHHGIQGPCWWERVTSYLREHLQS